MIGSQFSQAWEINMRVCVSVQKGEKVRWQTATYKVLQNSPKMTISGQLKIHGLRDGQQIRKTPVTVPYNNAYTSSTTGLVMLQTPFYNIGSNHFLVKSKGQKHSGYIDLKRLNGTLYIGKCQQLKTCTKVFAKHISGCPQIPTLPLWKYILPHPQAFLPQTSIFCAIRPFQMSHNSSLAP